MNEYRIMSGRAATLVAVVALIAGCGTTSKGSGSVIATSPAGAPPPPAAHSSTSVAKPAKVGDSLILSGMRSEKLTVTVVKVVDPDKSTDQFAQPEAGKHLVGVQIRIANTGTAPYKDSPDNGAALIDAQTQQYHSDYQDDTAAGKGFSGSVSLAPGASALGVIAFVVPDGMQAATFQFTLDSGFADQTGQWQLH